MAKQKNKPLSKKETPKGISSKEEYDLERNFKKVNRFSRYGHKNYREETETDRNEFSPVHNRTIRSTDEVISSSTNSGFLGYTRLEDQISEYSNKNESAHDSIRKDYELKINDVSSELKTKLSSSDFRWIIGGLLTILAILATIVFTMSYAPLIQDVKDSRENINNIDKNLNLLKSEQEHLKNDIDELKKTKTKPK